MERLSVAQERPLVVAHSTEGHLLACGTHEGTVWVWDVSAAPSGGPAALRFQVRPAHKTMLRLLFSSDGRWLAAYDEDDTIHLLDVARGQVAYSVAGVTRDLLPGVQQRRRHPDHR